VVAAQVAEAFLFTTNKRMDRTAGVVSDFGYELLVGDYHSYDRKCSSSALVLFGIRVREGERIFSYLRRV